ncbi:hypothetical protein ACB098_12G167100 [Castanea mollissima]
MITPSGKGTKVDLYSFGVILMELITGFERSTCTNSSLF